MRQAPRGTGRGAVGSDHVRRRGGSRARRARFTRAVMSLTERVRRSVIGARRAALPASAG